VASRVFVNTECSQCGGSLNLEEGSNAVSCPYCGSSFLITGYDKILSYYIPKNLEDRRTAVQALARRYLHTLTGHCRVEEINLFHIPYYRLRGEIFQLIRHHPEDTPELPAVNEPMTTIHTRHLDRSFPATSLEGLPMYSLGIRTSVLQLRLFKPETLREKGKVYPVTIGIDRALDTGLGKRYKGAPDTCVISQILSIVYAPIWEANIRGIDGDFSLIIDALSETIIEHRASFRFLSNHLPEANSPPSSAISFHALSCPNCGWDITPDAKLCVFVCNNCRWVWECGAQGLKAARGFLVPAPAPCELQHLIYLPFWIFPAEKNPSRSHPCKTAAAKIFIPAFGSRDLNVLHRLASAFTSVQPGLDLIPLSGDLSGVKIEGAVLRWEDAVKLAGLFAGNGIQKIHLLPRSDSSRQLVWLPFYEKGIYLRDALLNTGTQKAKL
jgi:predicted RNA-binding Zn-ribbon protein involved in translation (DUF1610 family)